MAGLDPNSPLVQQILAERLRQQKATFDAQQKQQSGGGGGSMFSSLIPMAALIGGSYLGHELMKPSSPSSSGGSSIFSNMFGGGEGGSQIASQVAGAPETPQLLGGEAVASGGGMGSYALPLMGGALGAYGLYDTLSGDKSRGGGALQGGLSGAAMGASLGSVVPGIGTALGAGIGAVAGGGLGGLFGKDQPHPDTQDRSAMLGELSDRGITQGLPMGNARDPSSYNVANNTPETVTGQIVGAIDPLASILVSKSGANFQGGDFSKHKSDLSGMLTNAVQQSGGNPAEAIRGLYMKAGLDRNSAYNQIQQLSQTGALAPAEANAALASIDKIFGVRNPNAPKEDQARFDQFQKSGFQGQPGQAPAGLPQPAQLPALPAPGMMQPPIPGTKPAVTAMQQPALTPAIMAKQAQQQAPARRQLYPGLNQQQMVNF